MERELIVTLLKKNIDDLILLTEGFEEMTVYPRALIHLAQLKTNDIKQYLYELGEWKPAALPVVVEETLQVLPPAIPDSTPEQSLESDPVEPLPVEPPISEILTVETSKIQDESDTIPDELPEMSIEKTLETLATIETSELPAYEAENTGAEEETEGPIAPDEEPVQPELPEEEVEVLSAPDEEEKSAPDEKEKSAPDEEEKTPPQEEDPQDEEISTPDENEKSTPQEEDKKQVTLAEKLAMGMSRNESQTNSESNRLSNSLGNTKIDDIRQAISIGDRFRFQRELFRNNGEEMNKMLNYINLLASFQEIESFLQKKYGWTDDNQTAKDLYAIVRRKFL